MTDSIRITDLAQPELSELQQSIHDFGESLDVSLSAEDILTEAKSATGLNDFGSMDFLARLELLCDEWSNDTGLNNLGRMSLRNKLLLFAKNRLLILRL